MPYLPSSSPLLDINSYPPRDEAGATEARHVQYVSRLCRMLGVRAPSLAVVGLSLPRPIAVLSSA